MKEIMTPLVAFSVIRPSLNPFAPINRLEISPTHSRVKKRPVPVVMRDIELDSIRNFKFQPDTGSIVIDEPDKGDYHFHFE